MRKPLVVLLLCGAFTVTGCGGGSKNSQAVNEDEVKQSSQDIAKENAEKYKNYKPGRPGGGNAPGK